MPRCGPTLASSAISVLCEAHQLNIQPCGLGTTIAFALSLTMAATETSRSLTDALITFVSGEPVSALRVIRHDDLLTSYHDFSSRLCVSCGLSHALYSRAYFADPVVRISQFIGDLVQWLALHIA